MSDGWLQFSEIIHEIKGIVMQRPEPPFEGACLCGAVEVLVTAPPLLTVACHCRDCQKFSASAYSLTTMVPSDGFSHTGEVIRGGLGAGPRAHYFCATCLNFIYSRVDWAEDRVNLRTSLLDQAGAFVPFIEVMTEEKMPWAEVPVAHSFARAPASAEELRGLMEAYARR